MPSLEDLRLELSFWNFGLGTFAQLESSRRETSVEALFCRLRKPTITMVYAHFTIKHATKARKCLKLWDGQTKCIRVKTPANHGLPESSNY